MSYIDCRDFFMDLFKRCVGTLKNIPLTWWGLLLGCFICLWFLLTIARIGRGLRYVDSEVELIRQENVEIKTELDRLSGLETEFNQLSNTLKNVGEDNWEAFRTLKKDELPTEIRRLAKLSATITKLENKIKGMTTYPTPYKLEQEVNSEVEANLKKMFGEVCLAQLSKTVGEIKPSTIFFSEVEKRQQEEMLYQCVFDWACLNVVNSKLKLNLDIDIEQTKHKLDSIISNWEKNDCLPKGDSIESIWTKAMDRSQREFGV